MLIQITAHWIYFSFSSTLLSPFLCCRGRHILKMFSHNKFLILFLVYNAYNLHTLTPADFMPCFFPIKVPSWLSAQGNLIYQNSVSRRGRAMLSWAMAFIKHAEHKLLTLSTVNLHHSRGRGGVCAEKSNETETREHWWEGNKSHRFAKHLSRTGVGEI